MENPFTWGPAQKAINSVLWNDKIESNTANRVILVLACHRFLNSNPASLIDIINQCILNHMVAMEQGEIGYSLPTKIYMSLSDNGIIDA